MQVTYLLLSCISVHLLKFLLNKIPELLQLWNFLQLQLKSGLQPNHQYKSRVNYRLVSQQDVILSYYTIKHYLLCNNKQQKSVISVTGWLLTGRRHIHIGREMSCCTCSLIKSTSWDGVQTNGERWTKRRRRSGQTALCMTDFYYTSAYNKSLHLKYLEAFMGYNQSAAGCGSRF